MNRRTFLHTSLAAELVRSSSFSLSLAAATAPALLAAASPRRIKLGFLGVAHSHADGKLKALQSSPDWELIGIAESDPKLRAKHESKNLRFLSPGELLRDTEVIAVESAVRDHYRHAKLALAAGRHVHVEKPPAVTLSEFRELVELARSKGRLMQMGYMWRYHPGFIAILDAAKNGWLGQVSLVRGAIDSSYAGAARTELAEFRGGGMFELGCHLIDAVVRLLGKPDKVTPLLRTHGATDSLVDNALATFEYPHALATISVNLMHPGAGAHRFFEVVGTNGTALMRPLEQPTLQFDLAKAAGPYTKGIQTLTLPKYERYVPEFADLADAVRRARPLTVTPETDLVVHESLLFACAMI